MKFMLKGKKMYENNYKELLYKIGPLRRDLISDGYKEAITLIQKQFSNVQIIKYKSGEKCWTWTIPEKWALIDAYIMTKDKKIIFNLDTSNLFVTSNSSCIDRWVKREELLDHIYTHEIDGMTPYTYSFYRDNWSFNLTKEQKASITDDEYYVHINSRKETGELMIGSWILPGKIKKKIVIAAHLDHPFQINDGLSGVISGLRLFEMLSNQSLYYTYQLLIFPETIGSIAWLSHNEEEIPNIIGGIFLEMTGTDRAPSLQKSYLGNTTFDLDMSYLFTLFDKQLSLYKYRMLPGNDERQFNAPGVRIPMLSFCRCEKPESEEFPYREYHTDGDNLNYVKFKNIMESANLLFKVIRVYDQSPVLINKFKGELFMTNLEYEVGYKQPDLKYIDCLKIIDMIDGYNSAITIAQMLQLDVYEVIKFLRVLQYNDMVAPID